MRSAARSWGRGWAAVCAAILLAACGAATPAPEAGGLASTEQLRGLIPAFDGWTRGDVKAQSVGTPTAATAATATYTSGDGQLELEISDTGGDPRATESLVGIAGTNMNREVANGYFKGTTVAGAPAVESWNTQERMGELTVLVRNRYIIHVAGRGLSDTSPMRALAERVNLARLP
jgi:hypothetical protein